MELSYFLDQFRKLNTAKRMGRSAPHKAVMILSVIDLVESERIKKPVFELDEALEKKFHELWKRYVGTSILFKPVPATPFFHLHNEPFWNLFSSDGLRIEDMTTTPSLGFLRNNHVRAAIDPELFSYMKSSDDRARMRTALISTYLNQPDVKVRKVLPIIFGIAATRLWI